MGYRVVFYAIGLTMIFSASVHGEKEKVDALVTARAGQAAPELNLDRLLQAPSGARADWASLRGKVVVLEFWSTTCAPCLRWSPHVNKLGVAFEKKPVVFISITDEDEATVRRCLKKFPMHGWIGLAKDHSLSDAYGIKGLPSMVIVGKDGKLLGWTRPSMLTAYPEILGAALAGKTHDKLSTLPLENTVNIDHFRDIDAISGVETSVSEKSLPIFSILIRKAEGGEKRPNNGLGNQRNTFDEDVTMLRALAHAYDVTTPYIVSESPLPENPKYDILFRWNKRPLSTGKRLLQEALQATFDLEVQREMRMMDVFVLGYP